MRLSGHSEGLFGLGERKDSGKGDAFRFFVTNFMTHFHELVYLYCAISCDYGRSDGLGFAGFDFRFRWSSGGSLLCGFRKRVFQDVTYKLSFSEKIVGVFVGITSISD